jgi:hypothetical protein
MSDLRKAAEMALWALRYINQYSLAPHNISLPGEIDTAVDALRAALAQPEPIISPEIKGDKAEPAAYQWLGTSVIRKRIPKTAEAGTWRPLYAVLPQRKPLTYDVMYALVGATLERGRCALVRAVEQAHGIGND